MRIPICCVVWSTLLGVGLLFGCTRPDPPSEPIRAVRTTVVFAEAAGGTLEYAAEVRARTESRLGFRIGGKIVRRNVDLGATVKAGQLLARLDPQDAKLGQDAAGAALVAAQASFEQALADFKRFKELKDKGFISSAELERRETALTAARAGLDQARAQSSIQGNQAAYATLFADAKGVVTEVNAEPGMVVSAGTPVLRLAHDGPRDVVFSVPEDKVAQLRTAATQPGALTVRLWGERGTILPASLREVAAAADATTRTFLVKADIGRAPVRLGQTATVSLSLPKTEGVIKLPLTAVAELSGKTVVWLLDRVAMTVNPTTIQVTGAEGNSVVVATGLKPGQVVVTAGVHVLTPGQKVKLYNAPTSGTAASSPTR